jgi:hypothetical protein
VRRKGGRGCLSPGAARRRRGRCTRNVEPGGRTTTGAASDMSCSVLGGGGDGQAWMRRCWLLLAVANGNWTCVGKRSGKCSGWLFEADKILRPGCTRQCRTPRRGSRDPLSSHAHTHIHEVDLIIIP